jgi:hypothetical protein
LVGRLMSFRQGNKRKHEQQVTKKADRPGVWGGVNQRR